MYISTVYVYRTDANGLFDEDEDLLDAISVLGILTQENFADSNILDNLIEGLGVGTHLRIDVFVLKYTHFIDETDDEEVEALLASLVENLGDMIEDNSLILLDDFLVTTTIRTEDINDFY